MIKLAKDSLILSKGANKKYDLPFLWLRDNCQCDECRIVETQEKQFLLHTVPADISPRSAEVKDDNLLVCSQNACSCSHIIVDFMKLVIYKLKIA